LATVLGAYLLLVSGMLGAALRKTGGHLVYPTDDTYISMSLAKNLAAHGTLGITKYEYSACSSTPLYIPILAATFRIFGPLVVLPLLINVLAGIALLWLAARILTEHGMTSPHGVAAVLLVLLLAVPMTALTILGMEHLIHAAATLAFAWYSAACLSSERRPNLLLLCGLAFLLGGIRYEGLFTVGGACLLLLLAGKIRPALLSGAAAVIPATAVGLYSVRKGWFFLPNSLLLKGSLPQGGTALFFSVPKTILLSVCAPALLLATLALVSRSRLRWNVKLLLAALVAGAGLSLASPGNWLDLTRNVLVRLAHLPAESPAVFGLAAFALLCRVLFARRLPATAKYMTGVFLISAILHQELANYGWFYRYESYLVALGIVTAALCIWDLRSTLSPAKEAAKRKASEPRRRAPGTAAVAAALVALATLVPLLTRSFHSLADIGPRVFDIYGQQYQMASFFRTYYPHSRIALNDVGAVTFYGDDLHCLDLAGLASIDAMRLRRRGNFTLQDLDDLVHRRGTQVIAVYDKWFGFDRMPAPRDWIRVEKWTIAYSRGLGDRTVSFYGVGMENAWRLRANLRKFDPQLPEEVSHASGWQ
jgi:hypothetical protein